MLIHVVGVHLVAEHKDYGLSGVNRNLQLGKQVIRTYVNQLRSYVMNAPYESS